MILIRFVPEPWSIGRHVRLRNSLGVAQLYLQLYLILKRECLAWIHWGRSCAVGFWSVIAAIRGGSWDFISQRAEPLGGQLMVLHMEDGAD